MNKDSHLIFEAYRSKANGLKLGDYVRRIVGHSLSKKIKDSDVGKIVQVTYNPYAKKYTIDVLFSKNIKAVNDDPNNYVKYFTGILPPEDAAQASDMLDI